MSLETLMVRLVAIITPGTRVDDYGDTKAIWDTASETTTQGWISQQASVEFTDGRNATQSTLQLILPAGTSVTARDRVRIDGTVYEIKAEPHSAWTPRGEHHIEVELGKVIG